MRSKIRLPSWTFINARCLREMAAADKLTCIKDLRPGTKNVTCVFIVIDGGSTHHIKDGSVVRKCRVADKTGSVSFSLWNELGEAIEEGDILRLVNGYASLWKGTMVLYSGKFGKLEKIGEFTMVFSEVPDMSDSSHEFIQQHQKEKETQDSRHHSNGRSGSSHRSDAHGSRSGQSSGRLGLGHHGGGGGDGKRNYTPSPTGDHRPSPPHTCTSSHTSQHLVNNHSHSGGLRENHHHSINSGPLRTRQEVGGNRFHPYPNRR